MSVANKNIKRFNLKFLFFICCILTIQYGIGAIQLHRFKAKFYHYHDIHRYSSQKVDFLYFGSSVDFYSDQNDTSKKAISKILNDSQPNLKIANISKGAYNIGIFSSFIKNLTTQDYNQLPTFIFEVNLRAFSVLWHKRPEWQFEREQLVLNNNWKSNFYKPLSVLKHFPRINKRTFLSSNIIIEEEDLGVVADYDKYYLGQTELKDSLMLKSLIRISYLNDLDENHPKIKELLELINMIKKNNLRALFYITPIDYEVGEIYFPNRFVSKINKNISFIKSYIHGENINLVNLSTSLSHEDFSYNQIPNEHLKENGRIKVANQLSNWIDSLPSERD